MTEKYIGIKNLKKTTSEPYSYALSTILRISHFYAGNFYVYKYAVGQIVAINVAKQILDGDKDIKTKLFKFLESGISRSPLETIKLLGVDMTTDKPYIEAGKFVKKLLEMYKKTK
jgi:oligoendopeptidase F